MPVKHGTGIKMADFERFYKTTVL